jgi:hypothetical protein
MVFLLWQPKRAKIVTLGNLYTRAMIHRKTSTYGGEGWHFTWLVGWSGTLRNVPICTLHVFQIGFSIFFQPSLISNYSLCLESFLSFFPMQMSSILQALNPLLGFFLTPVLPMQCTVVTGKIPFSHSLKLCSGCFHICRAHSITDHREVIHSMLNAIR